MRGKLANFNDKIDNLRRHFTSHDRRKGQASISGVDFYAGRRRSDTSSLKMQAAEVPWRERTVSATLRLRTEFNAYVWKAIQIGSSLLRP